MNQTTPECLERPVHNRQSSGTIRREWEHDREAIRYGWNFVALISETRAETQN
jgi:hypothetical protein